MCSAEMDKDGDGSVSADEMASALKGAGKGGHHHHHVAASDGSDSTSADGASSDTVDAGVGGYILDLGHQQRRFDHDVTDLCRWLEGDDDLGRSRLQLRDIFV